MIITIPSIKLVSVQNSSYEMYLEVTEQVPVSKESRQLLLQTGDKAKLLAAQSELSHDEHYSSITNEAVKELEEIIRQRYVEVLA